MVGCNIRTENYNWYSHKSDYVFQFATKKDCNLVLKSL